MTPRIETIAKKKLVGMKVRLTIASAGPKTQELWQGFRPRVDEVQNTVGPNSLSVQQYDPGMSIASLTPATEFNRWATVEVAEWGTLPEGMEQLMVPAGMYAIFVHKGPAQTFIQTWLYIFQEWLPASDYALDERPHFEVLTPAYRLDDPNAEEEIYIPIKLR
ncbi:MAG: AraC family transcriptional regulator [Anaerolineae bacterium]|nr:AraC family transcriptional regulator [Anaerolineae bacterium]